VYRNSVRNGRPLSTPDLARIAGCSPTTAWRAIQTIKQTTPTASGAGTGAQDIEKHDPAAMSGSPADQTSVAADVTADHR
jgi:hypothetical protein